MNEKELFLSSINAAREKHEENMRLENKRKKDIVALAEALKKFDPVPTEEELYEQEKRQKDIDALAAYLTNIEEQIEIIVEDNPEFVDQINEEISEAVTLNETPEPIVEMGRQPEPELPVKDIVTKGVEFLAKTKPQNIQQAADSLPSGVRKELDIIKKSITDLHRFASRQSQMGGGGEVNLRFLDDVDRSTIYQGHFLTYDNSTKKFVFSQIAEGNVDLSHIDQSLMPGANGVYNLGSPTDYWSNVYADTLFLDGGGLNANGSFGSNGQTLTSNGTSVYWKTPTPPTDFLHLTTSIIPNTDNSYTLGNTSNRWQSVHIGPGTLFIQDQSNSALNAALTVNNGVLQINGTDQLQVGQLKFVNNTIQSTTSNVNIEIGQTTDTANLVIDRNMVMANGKSITFGDNTTQNTAYIPASYISTYYGGANVVVANTAQTYIVPIGTQIDGNRNITVGTNNAFVISHTGKYLINYSVQYENSDSSQNDIYVWVNQNNAPLANSSTIFTAPPRKNPSITGKIVAVSPIFLSANSGDKIQIMTAAPDAPASTISICSFAARTNPTIPVTPAVLITIQEVN